MTSIFGRRVVRPDGVGPALIEVEGATIQRVREATSAPEGAIDYGDRLIAPAFVDAHTHLALTALRGAVASEHTRTNVVEDVFFRFESQLTAADVRAFVRVAAFEALLAGIGLVWDHYYFGEAVAGGLADAQLCGVVAPTLLDGDGPSIADDDAQLAATEALDGDAWAARGIASALGPHATDTVSEALWRRILEVAEGRSLPIHLHLAQSIEELERALERRGCTPVAWLDRLGVFARRVVAAHGIFISDAELVKLAGTDSTLVWCPQSAWHFGLAARPERWSDAGVPWVVATDAAATNDAVDVQQELRIVASVAGGAAGFGAGYESFLRTGALEDAQTAWRHRVRDHDRYAALTGPRALLQRVWSIPGGLHPRLQAGVIAPGALANLAVWDLDHPALWPGDDPLRSLALSHAAPALYAMWTAGRRIGTDGDLARSLRRSAAYREANKEARERLRRLR